MSRLIGLVKSLFVAATAWLVLGVIAQQVAFGFLSLVPGVAWGWLLYGIGLILAFSVPLLVWVRMRDGRNLTGVILRVVLVASPVFFCGQFIVGGTPDWNPVPLLVGYGLCLIASIATWAILRSAPGRNRQLSPS